MGKFWSRSSRGLGHRPFTAVTGVRLPYGTPFFVTLFFMTKKTREQLSWQSATLPRLRSPVRTRFPAPIKKCNIKLGITFFFGSYFIVVIFPHHTENNVYSFFAHTRLIFLIKYLRCALRPLNFLCRQPFMIKPQVAVKGRISIYE